MIMLVLLDMQHGVDNLLAQHSSLILIVIQVPCTGKLPVSIRELWNLTMASAARC
jgi:hypothetical protein